MDTTEVELPPGFDELIEKLAKHNHDIWARRRLAEGWRWGPERNDRQKHHLTQSADCEWIAPVQDAAEIGNLQANAQRQHDDGQRKRQADTY